jgi:predicted HicB family RNase H-like nuclease
MSDTEFDAMKVPFNLRLPGDMLREVDARAERLGISRNQWFSNMTKWVLKHTEVIERKGGKP